MTIKQNNGGFTLLELIISIAIGTLITAAATTTLLFGFRINAMSTSTVKHQNTANMLVHVVETIANEGPVVVSAPNPEAEGYAKVLWQIMDAKDANNKKVYLMYSQEDISFNDGTKDIALKANKIYLNGTVFMEDVESFEAGFDRSNRLLTIEITTESNKKSVGSSYTASKYCRLNTPTTEGD